MEITIKIKPSPDQAQTSLFFVYQPVDEEVMNKHQSLLNEICADSLQPTKGLFTVLNMKRTGQDIAYLITSRRQEEFSQFITWLNEQIPIINQKLTIINLPQIPLVSIR